MKKLLPVLLLSALLLLAGCGHEHQWSEPTCTEPATCSVCGRTDGEALGHDYEGATCTEPATCRRCGMTIGEALGHTWIDATCTAPKTCSVCGATEGEPIEHTWIDATCSAPKTCSVCGATEGEPIAHTIVGGNYQEPGVCSVCGAAADAPLTSPFEAAGYTVNAGVGDTLSYVTKSGSGKTTASAVFSDVAVSDTSDLAESKDGYVFQTVTLTMTFSDDQARKNGMQWFLWLGDCFEAEDDVPVEAQEGGTALAETYITNWYGEDIEILRFGEQTEGSWNDAATEYTAVFTFTFRVPKGYDGVLIGLVDAANYIDSADLADLIDSNTQIVRLPAAQ